MARSSGTLPSGALAPFIMSYANVMVRPWDFQAIELVLIPGLVILASVVGFLPAVVAYRTDVAKAAIVTARRAGGIIGGVGVN